MTQELEDKLDEARELILQADSILSYLWHRGYIDMSKIDYDLSYDIERLLSRLRVGV